MAWELKQVEHTDWIQDNSGYYALINWVDENTVRLDVMGIADSLNPVDYPIMSFQGTASDVRKHAMQWQDSKISQKAGYGISCEHAAYIGAELARAELLGSDYVQD